MSFTKVMDEDRDRQLLIQRDRGRNRKKYHVPRRHALDGEQHEEHTTYVRTKCEVRTAHRDNVHTVNESMSDFYSWDSTRWGSFWATFSVTPMNRVMRVIVLLRGFQ